MPDEEKDEVKPIKVDNEEQSLSHKERRKRRRAEALAQQNAINGEQNQSSNREISENKDKEDSQKKSPYAVWIGNLSFKTTKDKLKSWIIENIEDEVIITRINMPNGNKTFENNKGFAYVDVQSNDIVESIIKNLNEVNLDGRKLLIKSASDFSNRPTNHNEDVVKGELSKFSKKILNSQKNKPNSTLFFGNLPFEITEQDFIDFLAKNSETLFERRKSQGKIDENTEFNAGIKNVKLGTFEDSGKCKGWCFVDFNNVDYATHALCDSHNHTLYGRNLTVEFGQDRSDLKRKRNDNNNNNNIKEKGNDGGKKFRAKPGAALANAQRSDKASGAINNNNQPAGNKITFDD